MSKRREEERSQKRKKRAAKARGKALENWVDERLVEIGIDEGEGVIQSVNFGIKRPDVVREKGWIKLVVECKNRANWKSKGIMDWLDQAEGYLDAYDDVRWGMVVHCNSPGRGKSRDPIVVCHFSAILEMLERFLKEDSDE